MDSETDKLEVGEKAVRTCVNCGNQDTDDYCSKCGSKLKFLGEEKDLPIRNLRNILKGYFNEILDPVFAYIKTIWLLLFHPITFFRALYFKDQPISNIHFPLASLWRKVSGDIPQHILDPVAFYASNLLINIISLAILIIGLAAQFLVQQFRPDSDMTIPYGLSSAGFFALLYMLAAAFVFDTLTEKDKIPPNYKYSFWVYIFSLIWLIPLLSLLIKVIFLPVWLLMIGIGFILEIVGVLILSNSAVFSQIDSAAREIYNSITTFFNQLILSATTIYLFLVTPLRVFSNIYGGELSQKKLVIVLLVSVIGPGIALCLLCSFPLLLF